MARIEADVMLADRYRLLDPLASGGMGSVWEAEDLVLHRRVAVKVLSDGLSEDRRFVERFRREARAAAGLSHPNVAGVFDYGEDQGSSFIVMELLDGETLADRVAGGPMDPAEAVRIAGEVAEALQAAHDSGIVHRDVKPGNVMLTSSGEVKVMDFGIVSAAWASSLTTTGHTMGTAAYISPEQARGEPADARSDVYSLGVVLYEMLAGRPPFTGGPPVAIAAAHARELPPPLSEARPDCPPHVAAACDRALAKDPNDRPASAAAFAEALRATESDRTVTIPKHRTEELPATSVGSPARAGLAAAAAWLSRRRRPSWVLLAIAALFALVALALVTAVGNDPLEPPRPRVTVPEIIGASPEDATAALEAAGLSVGGVEFVEGEQGVVVGSDPEQGASVRPGTSITLFVGAAPPEDQGENGNPGNGKGKGKGKGGEGGND